MEIKRLLTKLQSNKKKTNKEKNKKKKLSTWREKWNPSKLLIHHDDNNDSFLFEQVEKENHPYLIPKRHHSIPHLNTKTSIPSLSSKEKKKKEIGNSIQRPFSCLPTSNHHLLSVPHVIDELRATSSLSSSLQQQKRHSTSSSIYTSSSSYYSRIDLLNHSTTSLSIHEKDSLLKNETMNQSIHEQSNEDHFTTSTTLHQHDSKYDVYHNDKSHHKELVQMNVNNMMMMMREHQLELELTKMKIENQQLQQQMDDIANGTWTSTTQLLEENERLEREIEQLKNNPIIHYEEKRLSTSSIEEEEETLRHTRAQLGLIEYLEGEPDILDALKRFKQLLISSTNLY